MNLGNIIRQSKQTAGAFRQKGHKEVRLPVFAFEDWREVYSRPADGQAVSDFRTHLKRNWYLMHYLRRDGVRVVPVPVRSEPFKAWAAKTGHTLSDGHELAHAVGEYVNDDLTPVAYCRHGEPDLDPALEPDLLATITVFGDDAEMPEVMSAVLHRPDGSVLDTLEILAVECDPQEAWQRVGIWLDDNEPKQVFHDKVIRRPEYCADCNGLLVNVASSADQEQAARQTQNH